MSEDYTLDYAASAVQHLGVGLYKQLPQALAELITNSWDADATEVKISINYREKTISVFDNGNGMTHDELNSNFLRVAKNRRSNEKTDLSPSGRKVTGKKGLGKLALFGIANRIQVFSCKEGVENAFEMNFTVIQNTPEDERYHPKALINNKKNEEIQHGTKIIINDLTLKSITPLDDLAISLAKRFDKYSKDNFLLTISDDRGGIKQLDETAFENSIKPNNVEFKYNFPSDFLEEIAKNNSLKEIQNRAVTGTIFTKSTPLRANEQGFSVLSRGKLASDQTTRQFSERANDRFYDYAAGFFDIDFIDDDLNNDYISTDRQSILWDSSEDLIHLRENLNKLINVTQAKWRKDRDTIKRQKAEKIKKRNPIVSSVQNSKNLTQSDKETLDQVAEMLEDDENIISQTNKEKLLEKFAQKTTAYQIDNSHYYEIIPKDFEVPQSINEKIWHLRQEAVSAEAGQITPDRFLLGQGLWLRALIDSTTTSLLVQHREEINKQGGIFRKNQNDDRSVCNMDLREKWSAMICFLEYKKVLSNKRSASTLVGSFTGNQIVEKLNLLMHDYSYWPKAAELKTMWDTVSPELMKSFKFIKK